MMAAQKDKSLKDPSKRIFELKKQILILEAELTLARHNDYWDIVRNKGMRKWNIGRHLGYWLEILEHQKKGRHLRAIKTHTEPYCVCGVLNCPKMYADE